MKQKKRIINQKKKMMRRPIKKIMTKTHYKNNKQMMEILAKHSFRKKKKRKHKNKNARFNKTHQTD